ncbi:Uncharacterised protein [uncultured archaeon]|nr:Uncharacterised protein [uncultured archaeon]
MIKCGNCGKEISAGAGHQTSNRGFVCYGCAAALNIQTCVVCGQKFPFSDMVEFQGEFFCKDDHKGRMAQIESYKPKPQPKGPMVSGATGMRLRRPRVAKAKVPYESVSREIRAMSKPVNRVIVETKEPEKELSKEEEKAEVSDMLKELHKEGSSPKKRDNEEISQVLKKLKSQDKDKKE